MFDIPILFLVFNRLDTTKQVFEMIQKVAPRKLYLASDGPRNNRVGEKEKVREVRDYVSKSIDWNCEVKTLFRDNNLGCGEAVSGAITWFFENEEMGIILEDDCLPHMDFFGFCAILLKKYRDNENIGAISGTSFIQNKFKSKYSYYFGKYGGIWGWATWRRAWKGYKIDMSLLEETFIEQKINNTFKKSKERNYWKSLYKNKIQTIDFWDYQWCFHIWSNNRFSISPYTNLISNIGFGKGATHTVDTDSNLSALKTQSIFPIIYPLEIIIDDKIDKYIFDKYYCPKHTFIGKILLKLHTYKVKMKKLIQIKSIDNPEAQDLDLYWDEKYAKVLDEWGKDSVWNEIQMFLSGLNGKILDIACGSGGTIKLLEKYPDIELYGFDISDLLIQKAIEKGIPLNKLRVEDATKTNYPDNEFDYSYSIGSLEHFTMEGIMNFIKESARYTKTASFHMIPVSKSGKNEGWLKTVQSFFNNSEDWWYEKFKYHYLRVYSISSKWEDAVSCGKWFVCYK
jgi:ubiquinone/menaquinone biosynthesis C-methylase UbiE